MEQKDKYRLYWDICEKESHLRYPYCYDEPCVITGDRYTELTRVQQALYKAFRYFLPRFEKYEHIIEYSAKGKEIVSHYDLEKVRIGFYRPDFLIPENGSVKICELGCRYYEAFWGHGIFEYIMEKRNGCRNYLDGDKRITEKVIDGAYAWWTGLDKSLTVMQGRDREGDIRFYRPFFEAAGTEMRYIYPDTLAENMHLLEDGPVISAFSQMELEELTPEQIAKIAQADSLNPLPTIILLHDKRFLAVLWDEEFRKEALGEEEADFLAQFLIPTYTRKQSPEIWEKAYHNKNNYILKPQLLGKSEGIIPGPLVSEEEWKKVFEEVDIETMVLQEWVQQRKFSATIDGKEFQDYGTGILLCVENELQGLGQFRMSSCEVINYIKDDRKMLPWITDDAVSYHGNYHLL